MGPGGAQPQPRPPLRVLAAVALVAAATLALQVLVTRIFAALLYYHFGFLAVSLALLGVGAGALLVYLQPARVQRWPLEASLARWSLALAGSVVVAAWVLVKLDYALDDGVSAGFLLAFGAACAAAAVPFLCAGVTIALAVRGYTADIGRVYAFDLAGAAVGAAAVVPLLWVVDAPTLTVALAALGVGAAALFAPFGREGRWTAAGAVVVTVLVGLAAVTSLFDMPVRGDLEPVAERWTPLNRVLGFAPPEGIANGLVTYDRNLGEVIRFDGRDLPGWRELQEGPPTVGYELAPAGRALVIGGGGGRDVLAALTTGRRSVDVVELNRGIQEVVDEDLAELSGSPYSLPGVTTVIGDGRSTLASSDERYAHIQLGFVDTFSGGSAQAFALTENNLYTVEAFEEYLDHLAPGGVLNVSRPIRHNGDEALRATVLALETLRRRGVPDPERHVAVVVGDYRLFLTRFAYGTVLVKRDPFTAAELARLRRLAAARTDGVALRARRPLSAAVARVGGHERLRGILRELSDQRVRADRRQAVLLQHEADRRHRRALDGGCPQPARPAAGAGRHAGRGAGARRGRVRPAARAGPPRRPADGGLAHVLRRDRVRLPAARGGAAPALRAVSRLPDLRALRRAVRAAVLHGRGLTAVDPLRRAPRAPRPDRFAGRRLRPDRGRQLRPPAALAELDRAALRRPRGRGGRAARAGRARARHGDAARPPAARRHPPRRRRLGLGDQRHQLRGSPRSSPSRRRSSSASLSPRCWRSPAISAPSPTCASGAGPPKRRANPSRGAPRRSHWLVPRPLGPLAELYDLDELARARRLADWMFDQFRPFVADETAEVGAGLGTFSARLLEAGVRRLLLVEPDPDLAAVLARRLGADERVELVREALPDAPSLARDSGRYGFVLCQNVLEHVEEDARAVAAMAGALRPGGTLGVLVPAHPRLFGSLDRAFGHRRRYTRERLGRILAAAGLEVVELRSFNLLGVAGWWWKSRRGATSLGARSLRAYEAILPLWRPLERRLAPRAGLSLIAVARRPGRSGSG